MVLCNRVEGASSIMQMNTWRLSFFIFLLNLGLAAIINTSGFRRGQINTNVIQFHLEKLNDKRDNVCYYNLPIARVLAL